MGESNKLRGFAREIRGSYNNEWVGKEVVWEGCVDFEGAEALYARLGKHKKSVACLYVNKLDDVDLDVLREIIARQYAEDSHKGGDPSN